MTYKRLPSIDIVRGLVMIIMALDHVRDLLHVSALTQSPTDLNTTTPALFFSRWITYLCAPTFVFLSGASVWLAARNTNDKGMSRLLLVRRGLWLIVLEFTVINFSLWFDFQFRILMLQVIAATGVGFIFLSTLLNVSRKTIGTAAAVFLVVQNALQFIPQPENVFLNAVRNILFSPGLQQITPNFMFFISYPIVPWIAIMLLGYSLGEMFEREPTIRNRVCLRMGGACLVIFMTLRFLNLYGDPVPWSAQKNSMLTVLSFFNVTKYPPSLLFTLLFLGIMFLALRLSDVLPVIVKEVLSVYGRVPLFYYLLHLVIIRMSVFIMVFAQGYRWEDLLFGPFQFGRPASDSGIDLAGVIVVWVLIVGLLYPLCKWYGGYKKINAGVWWVKYM